HHFSYKKGVLHAEDVSLALIAAKVGTPFYCYSTATLKRHFDVFRSAFGQADATVHFAVKANSNLAVLRTLANQGAGFDVVSGGELKLALQAGADAAKIVFSGVGKTKDELRYALDVGIGQINIESESEMHTLSALAAAAGKTVRVALRVNPDVDAGTHAKITTGKKENKFGIEWTLVPELYRKAQSLPGLKPTAIAVHIGSQITDLTPFENAFLRVREMVHALRDEKIEIDHIDLGGGLGVPYDFSAEAPPLPSAYGAMVTRVFGNMGCKLSFEPGRVIVANAGVLVSAVTIMKTGSTKKFAIVDAGMNDLVRPAMYDAHHDIIPVIEPGKGAPTFAYDVVGPVCESSDKFATDAKLPALAEGDLIAFLTAGAYGAVMSSIYNTRPLVPEVLVDGANWSVVRRRPTYEEMLALEQLPSWLK
ncbi:MAG: diaminopimelate decarboxylase, partial [Rhodospirillaceae bacterium]|nr:diaminopimelate decarboxylase [Rhodospirillaceae bacterium]